MSTQTLSYTEVISNLPPDSTLVLRGVSWEGYEELLEAVGEAQGLRISYDEGEVQIVTLSSEHEYYADLIKALVSLLSVRLRIRVLQFGSVTMKQQRRGKGVEPDACFYIQSAPLLGGRVQLDFESAPPPDVVVEVDLHHGSLDKFPLYAALGVPEIWRYDGQRLTIHQLEDESYHTSASSRALPLLTGDILTEFLAHSQQEDQYETLLAFEAWLQTQAT